MKLHELIKEEQDINLIGLRINDRLVTTKTSSSIWLGDFDASHRNLTSLYGAPKETEFDFDCTGNKLKTLVGTPRKVGKDFFCSTNYLTSLEYAPSEVGRDFWCVSNPITNLKDIHKIVTKMDGMFYCRGCPIASHVLGLLLIPGLRKISGDTDWCVILNRHTDRGRASLIDAQNELIEAGYEEFAQL